MVSRYEWFSDWVDQNLLLTLALAPASNAAGLLVAFGASGYDQGERSFDEAEDLGVAVVRIGVTAGWAYAVEHVTTRGGDPDWLAHLSSTTGLAVSACFTETISVLLVARDGELVTGFDIVVPSIRYGADPHAFYREMGQAGFLDDGGPKRRGEPAARFIELVTGIVLTQEMLERSLPCATLP